MFGAKDMETILIEKQLRQGITGIKRIAEIQSQIINSSKSTICINIENTEYIASAFVPVIASMPQLHINNKRI